MDWSWFRCGMLSIKLVFPVVIRVIIKLSKFTVCCWWQKNSTNTLCKPTQKRNHGKNTNWSLQLPDESAQSFESSNGAAHMARYVALHRATSRYIALSPRKKWNGSSSAVSRCGALIALSLPSRHSLQSLTALTALAAYAHCILTALPLHSHCTFTALLRSLLQKSLSHRAVESEISQNCFLFLFSESSCFVAIYSPVSDFRKSVFGLVVWFSELLNQPRKFAFGKSKYELRFCTLFFH